LFVNETGIAILPHPRGFEYSSAVKCKFNLVERGGNMIKSILTARTRSVLLMVMLAGGPLMVSSDTGGSRGHPRFPDVYVKAGQQFYITGTNINKKDVQYYGSGGTSYFSADPGYVFGEDASPEYLFDVEADGTILPADSSNYTAPLTPGQYSVDLYWWSPVPPYDELIYIGSVRVFVTP
jgi:hypothetical protein